MIVFELHSGQEVRDCKHRCYAPDKQCGTVFVLHSGQAVRDCKHRCCTQDKKCVTATKMYLEQGWASV